MLSRAASVAWERYILRKQPDKLRRWAECSDGTELPERWRVGIRRQVSEIGGSSSLTRPWCGLVGARHAVPLRCFKIGRNRKSVIVVILNGMKWSESKTPVGESLFIFIFHFLTVGGSPKLYPGLSCVSATDKPVADTAGRGLRATRCGPVHEGVRISQDASLRYLYGNVNIDVGAGLRPAPTSARCAGGFYPVLSAPT